MEFMRCFLLVSFCTGTASNLLGACWPWCKSSTRRTAIAASSNTTVQAKETHQSPSRRHGIIPGKKNTDTNPDTPLSPDSQHIISIIHFNDRREELALAIYHATDSISFADMVPERIYQNIFAVATTLVTKAFTNGYFDYVRFEPSGMATIRIRPGDKEYMKDLIIAHADYFSVECFRECLHVSPPLPSSIINGACRHAVISAISLLPDDPVVALLQEHEHKQRTRK